MWQTDTIGFQKCDLGLPSHLLSLRQLQSKQSTNFPTEPCKSTLFWEAVQYLCMPYSIHSMCVNCLIIPVSQKCTLDTLEYRCFNSFIVMNLRTNNCEEMYDCQTKANVKFSLHLVNSAPWRCMVGWQYSSTILNFITRWRWVVNFLLCYFILEERSSGILCIGGWVGSRDGLWETLSTSELYRLSDRHFSVNLVPTFADRGGVMWLAWRIPYGCNLGFLDWSRYFFFAVAPQLYSRGWADPVPDPLLLRKSRSAGNWTRTSDH
jgi:hypothetical protein